MLTLTQDAIDAVKAIVSSSPDHIEEGGLRIAAQPLGGQDLGLELTVAKLPSEDDHVVEEEGARVFVDSQAAAFLADKTLDADVDGGRVEFSLHPQASA